MSRLRQIIQRFDAYCKAHPKFESAFLYASIIIPTILLFVVAYFIGQSSTGRELAAKGFKAAVLIGIVVVVTIQIVVPRIRKK